VNDLLPLWIVLGVLLVVGLVTAGTVSVRRRGRRDLVEPPPTAPAAPPATAPDAVEAPPGTATVEAPPEPDVAAPPALDMLTGHSYMRRLLGLETAPTDAAKARRIEAAVRGFLRAYAP